MDISIVRHGSNLKFIANNEAAEELIGGKEMVVEFSDIWDAMTSIADGGLTFKYLHSDETVAG